jgi:von Willebrand factor type A domain
MLKSAPPANRFDWLSDLNSWLLSAVFHLVAMVVLGLATVAATGGWAGIELVASVADRLDAPVGDVEALDSATTFELAHDDLSTAAGPLTLFDVSAVATDDLANLAAAVEMSLPASGRDGSGLNDLGEGIGGEAQQAEFFGIGGYGGSFVYVVDVSGSMSERGKYERARNELLRSIAHLSENQKYFVVFYNDLWYPMDADGPVLATRRQLEQTRRWVRHVHPSGGTYPLEALLFALSLEPDAVYFLSDGKFDPAIVGLLRQQDPPSAGQIPIHTISFVNRETLGLMRAIAENSGGQFRFVK